MFVLASQFGSHQNSHKQLVISANEFVCVVQTDPAPSVAQVLAGQAYTNGTFVTPAAADTITLPNAFTSGTKAVVNIDMASAYFVYLVGQDNNTTPSPNTMVNVSAPACCPACHVAAY